MKILLVHQNFPGQFRGLAPALTYSGHELRAVSMRPEKSLATVPNWSYKPLRFSTPQIHPWLVNTETAVIRGESAASAVEQMVSDGWIPDLVLGHTGWGEMLFMRQVLPKARLIGFNELFYQAQGGDIGFDPEFPADPELVKRLQVRNMHLTASLLACDDAVTPTQWQASCFPPILRDRISVIHDGIHTDQLIPNTKTAIRLGRNQIELRPGDEIITFVNRNLEPMRGYHQFMRSLPDILADRPNARIIIVGGDEVSYGASPQGSQSYKEIYLNEVRHQIDMTRVHYVSRVPYKLLMDLLRVSAVHVYLTVPFVLSWSLLEAMSLGAMVIGSDTAPVREVISHGKNGLLVDFFNPKEIAKTVCEVLNSPQKYKDLRINARKTVVDRYDFKTKTLPEYMQLIKKS